MKKLILAFACCVNLANAKIVDRVIDGDTFVINEPNPPVWMLQKNHRLMGIDTPESFKQVAKCQKEVDLGNKAKEFVKEFLRDEVDVYYFGIDKYGRYLVTVEKNGQDLAQTLVKNGLAVYYDGGTKTKDWCK
jgi:endonuclease YncB( thermonuclease family)